MKWCDLLGLDRSILPKTYESSDITGVISRERGGQNRTTRRERPWSAEQGIKRPARSATGSSSQGGLLHHRDLRSGLRVHAEAELRSAGRVHTFCHAVQNAWHVMGVTQGAGLSLQWFRNQLAPGTAYDALTAEAAQAPAGSQGLFWLPYLMGERTPHLDAIARGGWIGLTASHTRADLVRAVLEGVAYSQKDCLDIVENWACRSSPCGFREVARGARSGVRCSPMCSISEPSRWNPRKVRPTASRC